MKKNYIGYILVVIVAVAVFVAVFNKTTERGKQNEQIEEIKIDTLSFKDSVYNYIVSLNIQHAEIVLKQAILESGHFSSKIFKENNNLFGMKVARQRPTTATGEQYKHAKYDSWQMSVVDYALWQTKYCHNLTESEYLEYLQRVYSTNKNYTATLLKIKHYENNKGLFKKKKFKY